MGWDEAHCLLPLCVALIHEGVHGYVSTYTIKWMCWSLLRFVHLRADAKQENLVLLLVPLQTMRCFALCTIYNRK